ncbi:hypothetical protein [Providencia rettgeri]|uniref:hypothetical protein n=1 Tax=Providencia rettgeri TaxID=587 RepID=UPI0034E0D917
MNKRWIVSVSIIFLLACKESRAESIEGNYSCNIGSLFNAMSHDRKGDFTFPFGTEYAELTIQNNTDSKWDGHWFLRWPCYGSPK